MDSPGLLGLPSPTQEWVGGGLIEWDLGIKNQSGNPPPHNVSFGTLLAPLPDPLSKFLLRLPQLWVGLGGKT